MRIERPRGRMLREAVSRVVIDRQRSREEHKLAARAELVSRLLGQIATDPAPLV